MNKFKNKKTVVDGLTFDSKKEARRYAELRLLEKAGKIGQLTVQPKFDIHVNGEKVCSYIADFSYLDPQRGEVIEDVKSSATKTPVYRLKKKLMWASMKIDIMEV